MLDLKLRCFGVLGYGFKGFGVLHLGFGFRVERLWI